ncbi:nitroreductase [Desulfuromonas soudanensis]|uniref:Nitroreductase n=1 Tax=Desulfuromonas soudanensis TaxID=1603606 RepID=A0A0M4D9K0_9BACT|nr:nitroreductase family protein [Desulfuromonas soudanensis]ALC18185.1 nitroreductase [Desulfuromonas soudanensis]
MSSPLSNSRTPEVDIDPMFTDRWSPRSFAPEPLSEEELQSLFEAARWAPSCYNEQPWLFVYAVSEGDRQRFATALVEQNRLWASRAPVLLFVVARLAFARNGKANRHAIFDAGAAWMSLALQARKRGLYAHAMAGFSVERAHEVLAVPRQGYEIMAAVALGRRDDPALLPATVAAIEAPNSRRPLVDVAFAGRFPAD